MEHRCRGDRARRGDYRARVATDQGGRTGGYRDGCRSRIVRRGCISGGGAMSARVLVAMSGGVDSSVAAAILRERGYDVVGVAMRLAPESAADARRRASCCSADDFEDARRVAERMDFPFYVVDMRAEFGARVIGNFVSEY